MSQRNFPGGSIDAAAAGNVDALNLYAHVLDQITAIRARIGGNIDNPNLPVTLDTPTPATFTVGGKDGHFIINITNPQDVKPTSVQQRILLIGTNPNEFGRKIQHRLQKSTDVFFATPALITELPLTYETVIQDKDPNQTKYWRLQSRYDGGPWNAWQLYQTAAVCGPFAPWSGLLATESNDLLNSTATTSDGSIAISQHGTATQIDIVQKTWNVGPQRIVYNAGTTDPGAYGTFFIFCVDVKKAGGSVTYATTTNQGDLAGANGIICFGHIKTLAGGGGVPIGGGNPGGGGCGITGAGVTRMDGTRTAIEKLLRGDIVKGIDGGPEVLQTDPIPGVFPAFRILGGRNTLTGCSNVHSLMRADGGFERMGRFVPTETVRTEDGADTISRIEFLGMRLVWELILDRTCTYCLDGFWSHNKLASA